MQAKQRLDALTSLRFFAAAMIVIHHSGGVFGLSTTSFFLWDQGVSFFFVLSGFILAYVYPKLETWLEIKHFWRARIARVWPTLLASFLLGLWLLPLKWEYKTGFANLFMINAWIPFPMYFFSYNSPSWSISTEFFFYLFFPFLIYQWDKTWLVKLLVSGFIVVLLILVSTWLQLPRYVSIEDDMVTSDALLYIHPISRIFEFIFGICVASYWSKQKEREQWSKSDATLYEIGVTFFAGICMFLSPLAGWVNGTWLGNPSSIWLYHCGSMFAFGLLIYVIAIGRGRITAWLSHPILVLLGEISFSLYLLHQILLRYYRANITDFPHLPNIILLVSFWVIVLLASYLMWALIEMPGRRLILGGQAKKYSTKAIKQSWRSQLDTNSRTILATIILGSLLSAIYFSMGNVNRISQHDADAITPKDLQSVVGTRFGNLFALRGIKIHRDSNGLTINLAWESLVEQKLAYTNAIHLTDRTGNILVGADYKQPISRISLEQGIIWKDTIFISAKKLSGKEIKLAVSLYPHNQPRQLLTVDRGNRDWGHRRLLIEFGNTINPIVSKPIIE